MVKDTHLKYGGIEYFRGNAATIRIGVIADTGSSLAPGLMSSKASHA